MKKKRIVFTALSFFLVAVIIGLIIYNGFKNESFWLLSLSQALTLLIALLIAFYASQFRNDERKLKETTEKLLYKLQNYINSDVFCNAGEHETKEVLMNNKRISNVIDSISKCSAPFRIKDDLDYINEEFKKYRDFVSEHIEDKDYLEKSKIEYQNFANNIDSKCDSIIISLYNK